MRIRFLNARIEVDGIDITDEIRGTEISELSSKVSAIKAVREELFHIQRSFAEAGKTILEGRDTGTVIFPEAGNKFFLDASIEERGRRRFAEQKDKAVDIEDTIEAMMQRDERDSKRAIAPLRPADDAVYIDTTGLGIEDVISRILRVLGRDP